MVYQWKPRPIAVVTSLHCTVSMGKGHPVIENSSSVIDVRGIGDKDRPTFSDMFWNGTIAAEMITNVSR